MPKFIDLSGCRFGRLVVVQRDTSRKGTYWSCLCDCGGTSTASGSNLNGGKHKSCGCLRNEKAAARFYRHGLVNTREYQSWMHAKMRCFNPNDAAYGNYGGRGISMCTAWAESFEQFFKDMGPCPTGMMIDRINNDWNYEPGNCRWADRKTQNRNTRATVMLTHDGITLPLREWADRMGMNFDALRYRFENKVIPLFGKQFRLSAEQRASIRLGYAAGNESTNTLAAKYGVGRQTISNIIHESDERIPRKDKSTSMP